MSKAPETTPCQFCGEPTQMLATRQCDPCWEVRSRLGGVPYDVLRAMLADTGYPALPEALADQVRRAVVGIKTDDENYEILCRVLAHIDSQEDGSD